MSGARPARRGGALPLALVILLLGTVAAVRWVRWYRHHYAHPVLAMVRAAELQNTAPLPRATYHRRLEPAGNTVLHGAGQTDIASFLAYTAAVAPARPTVFMTYVDLRDDLPAYFARLQTDLAAADSTAATKIAAAPTTAAAPTAADAGTVCAPATATCAPSFARSLRKGWGLGATTPKSKPTSGQTSPGPSRPAAEPVIPQIGLSLNRGQAPQHYERETAQGNDDAALDRLCTGLNAMQRPVFLRPGYEFNGAWNGYLPTTYVAAFRRIAARVHTCAPRVAVVWDWSADAELDVEAGGATAPPASRWQPFYPGDDAVDWWALNLFTAASIRSAATEAFLQAAARSSHPVMIAESTPKGYQIATSPTVWPDWFAPYFALIHRHPGIRAFCYINWNWGGYPQWADWGDARVQTAPRPLQQDLRTELTRPLYR